MTWRPLTPTLVGVGGAAAVTAGLVYGLSFSPLLAGALGIVIGGGGALLTSNMRSTEAEADAERVAELLEETSESAAAAQRELRTLVARALWSRAPVDVTIGKLCASLQSVAALPAITERPRIDGDILMLHAIATESLPNVMRLARENDDMYPAFSKEARAEVVRTVQELGEQVRILADAVGRIEQDIIRGTSRDVHQHTEYVRARFRELGITDAADFDRAFRELEG